MFYGNTSTTCLHRCTDIYAWQVNSAMHVLLAGCYSLINQHKPIARQLISASRSAPPPTSTGTQVLAVGDLHGDGIAAVKMAWRFLQMWRAAEECGKPPPVLHMLGRFAASPVSPGTTGSHWPQRGLHLTGCCFRGGGEQDQIWAPAGQVSFSEASPENMLTSQLYSVTVTPFSRLPNPNPCWLQGTMPTGAGTPSRC